MAKTPEERREYNRKYYEENRERVRAWNKKWREANREDVNAAARARRAANPEKHKEYDRKYRERHPDKIKAKTERRREQQQLAGRTRERVMRLRCFEHYGTTCACCGEAEEMFLTFDHVNNDGYAHRKIDRSGSNLCRWLIKQGFPEGFQVLCMNCNWGKYRNGGVCPHKGKGLDMILSKRRKPTIA